MQRKLILAMALAAWTSTVAPCGAIDVAKLQPYLGEDVYGVAYLDLDKVDVIAGFEEVLKLVPPSERPPEASRVAPQLQKILEGFRARGVRGIAVPLRISDFYHGAPAWIVVLDEQAQPQQLLDDFKTALEGVHPGLGEVVVPPASAVQPGVLLAASSTEQLKLLQAAPGKPRAEVVEALEALGTADVGLMIWGDAVGRRVVREMFPTAPAPFAEIDGRLLADGMKWGGVTITWPPKPTVSLTLEARNPQIARTVEQASAKALVLGQAMVLKEQVSGPPDHRERAAKLGPLLALLSPKLEGSRLSLTFGDDDAEVDFLQYFVPKSISGAREKAATAHRMNSLKRIAMAMLTYESRHGALLPAASYDGQGRPLLSWRVHILPFFGEQALYDEFHLEEPWDSEHNRSLIARMPPIYGNGHGGSDIPAGKTTCLVPTGPGTLFAAREGAKVSAIKDGTSNTILALFAAPEEAVEWTRPSDLEVDLENPGRGLGSAQGLVLAAFVDGHVEVLTKSMGENELRKRLTMAAGD